MKNNETERNIKGQQQERAGHVMRKNGKESKRTRHDMNILDRARQHENQRDRTRKNRTEQERI